MAKIDEMPGEEMVDLFDRYDRPLGRVASKLQAHRQGWWHRSAHVWIYDRRGRVLLQKRAAIKDTFPGLWDISVAGHVSASESPLQGALRELGEEIGLRDVSPQELCLWKTFSMEYPYPSRGWMNREHCYVYLLQRDLDTDALVLQPEEVERVRYFTPGEFSRLTAQESGQAVPHEDYYRAVREEIVKKTFNI